MRKLADKFKGGLHPHHEKQPGPPLSSSVNVVDNSPLSNILIYRYRKQRGVNLGSWFVLERWIADSPFRSAHHPAQSDLDVARGANARQILEAHWDSWIVEADWAWIAQRGINSVRIPIGYYHLCGADASVLENTDFGDFEHVFSGAWSRITRAIETARKYGIGVLIDLHAAPGKQNSDAHSGTSEAPRFFSDKRHRKHAIHVLCVLLRSLKKHAEGHTPPLCNLLGIELLNEPQPDRDENLQAWYTSAIKELRAIDPTIPLYLGECWRTDQYAGYLAGLCPSSLTVLDHHLYRCFTGYDISTKAHQHAWAIQDPNGETQRMFERVAEKVGRAGGGLVVGEWSGALNPGSLTGSPGEVRDFVEAQLSLYERYCGGWYFWTYKKEHGGDTGWSFRDAVNAGVFPTPVALKPIRNWRHDQDRRSRTRDEQKGKALHEHTTYWSQYPGHYGHWRFEEGFIKGWDDGYMFLGSSVMVGGYASELGFAKAWAKGRTSDHGKHYWEFEHGFTQGAAAARRDFEQTYCM